MSHAIKSSGTTTRVRPTEVPVRGGVCGSARVGIFDVDDACRRLRLRERRFVMH